MDLRFDVSAEGAPDLHRSVELDQQARAALESRMVIGQAVGILMQRDGVDADGAFAMLVDRSQRTNTKLRDVARTIVETLDRVNGRR